jgi:hypothetical protein
MTLWNDLKDFFDKNTDAATDAMRNEGLWGYEIYWGANKGNYVVSDFEGWAIGVGIKKPKAVDNYGGEDQGTTYYTVYKFERDDEIVYIKFYGYYTSYDGSGYEGFRQVFPKEVTKVEYV